MWSNYAKLTLLMNETLSSKSRAKTDSLKALSWEIGSRSEPLKLALQKLDEKNMVALIFYKYKIIYIISVIICFIFMLAFIKGYIQEHQFIEPSEQNDMEQNN